MIYHGILQTPHFATFTQKKNIPACVTVACDPIVTTRRLASSCCSMLTLLVVGVAIICPLFLRGLSWWRMTHKESKATGFKKELYGTILKQCTVIVPNHLNTSFIVGLHHLFKHLFANVEGKLMRPKRCDSTEVYVGISRSIPDCLQVAKIAMNAMRCHVKQLGGLLIWHVAQHPQQTCQKVL